MKVVPVRTLFEDLPSSPSLIEQGYTWLWYSDNGGIVIDHDTSYGFFKAESKTALLLHPVKEVRERANDYDNLPTLAELCSEVIKMYKEKGTVEHDDLNFKVKELKQAYDTELKEPIVALGYETNTKEKTAMNLTFEQQSTEKTDETIKARDIEEAKPLVLQYIGTDTIASPKGESQLHKFYKANEKAQVSDKTLGVWGCTILNNEMAKVEAGSFVKLVRKPTPKGKNYLNFQVLVGKQKN